MTRIFYVLVIVAVLFFGVTFYYMNNQAVEINYLSISGTVSLPVLLLLTLVSGVVLGYLARFPATMRLRRNLSVARKELKNLGSAEIRSSSTSSKNMASKTVTSKDMESAGL